MKMIEDLRPTVIALQETMMPDNWMIRLKGYNRISKQGHYNRRQHGGVCLFIHEEVPIMDLDIQSPYQIVAARVQITRAKLVTFASVYIPGSQDWNAAAVRGLLADLPRPVLIMGDMNTHNELWGGEITDGRGRDMERIVRELGLNVINDGQPTHQSGTVVDITVAAPELATDITCTTFSTLKSSDHFPVFVTEIIPEVVVGRGQYNYKKGRWKECAEDGIWKTLPEAKEDPKTAVDEILGRVLEKYVPKYTRTRQYPKPWWTEECRNAYKEREKMYRKYKVTRTAEDNINWKRARAKATRTFRLAKKQEWRAIISALTINTPSRKVWEKINRIKGRTPRKINILQENGIIFSTTQEITDKMAETFCKVTRRSNCNERFVRIRSKKEANRIDFSAGREESYNKPITMREMKEEIHRCKLNSPGPDGIPNQLLKCLPEEGQMYVLDVFNAIWNKGYVHDEWRKAIIVPIAKPGKDHSNPLNYRPISLTSCVCKLFESVVNRRLTEYLERHRKLINVQCGFRKNRSTLDQLVRLEAYVRKSLAEGKRVVAVFVDLEKAYDRAWRYGMKKEMHRLGLRGRLPLFVSNFMEGRLFRIRMNQQLSQEYEQESGIAQGSKLSVTMFSLLMNTIKEFIGEEVFTSLYVDDIQVAYAHESVEQLEDTLQKGIDGIEKWAMENGQTISATKTVALEFFNRTEPVRKPNLTLNRNPMPYVREAKFLGLWWDAKLNWERHIAEVRGKCLKKLNLIRSVSAYQWGADTSTSMRIYSAVVRPMIDYGSVVYGSANRATLARLEVVANEAMRIATGAFKSTPVSSLQVLTNEPPLDSRRQELMLRYYYKIRSIIQSPAHNSIANNDLRVFLETRPSKEPTTIMRIQRAIGRYALPTQPVLVSRIARQYSWDRELPELELRMRSVGKTDMPSVLHRAVFEEVIEEDYRDWSIIYTDGSKMDQGVGAAAVFNGTVRKASLPRIATIGTAEVKAIQLAIGMVRENAVTQCVICTDSLSAIEMLQNVQGGNELTDRVQEYLSETIKGGVVVKLMWVPGHAGIAGNERADTAAKEAAGARAEFIQIPYQDWYPEIRRQTYAIWKQQWQRVGGKLTEIKPVPSKWKKIQNISRRTEVILNRLRLGHTHITQSYLFEGEVEGPPPVCGWCNQAVVSVKHILIECGGIQRTRASILAAKMGLTNVTMKKVLGDGNVKVAVMIEYLAALGLCDGI